MFSRLFIHFYRKLVYYFAPLLGQLKSSTSQIGFYVNIKVWFQGPYLTGTHVMNTFFNSVARHLLPLAHPYSGSPWNYSGTEAVTLAFYQNLLHFNITDWILIELRSGTAASTIVARRAGFLLKTGRVVDIDGFSDLNFPTIPSTGNYYVVVRHRNQLSIMSNATINGNGSLCNLSILANIYGGDAKLLETGVYGMYAGDANADGDIQWNVGEPDYITWNLNTGSGIGYWPGDVNLDGQANVTDRNVFGSPNQDITTKVPN